MKLLKVVPLIIFCSSMLACGKKTLFESVSSSQSGINFNNQIIENDTINELDIENVYNGGGVGVGDFNNDGLQDLFFSGNLVSCKLYLNKGGFQIPGHNRKSKSQWRWKMVQRCCSCRT
jgi:hypothetical protein